MKKTNATLLTAAMFAAAANLVPGSGSAASQIIKSNPIIGGTVQATTTEIMNTYTTVYGPPWMFGTTTAVPDEDEPIRQSLKTQPAYGPPIEFMTTTNQEEEEIVTAPPTTTEIMNKYTTVYGPPWMFETTTIAQPTTTFLNTSTTPLYGPPWVFGTTTTKIDPYDVIPQPAYGPPMMIRGDLTNDGRVNAFDLIEAKQLLLHKDNDSIELFNKMNAADFNRDGRFSMADVIGLSRFLLGDKEGYDEKIDDEGNPVATTTNFNVDENEKTTTQTTHTSTYIPDEHRVTTPLTTVVEQPMYGPPWVFDK